MRDKTYSYKAVFYGMIGLILTIVFYALFGCSIQNKMAQRPYIVVSKVILFTDKGVAEYRFKDASGKIFMFYDNDDYYNEGDTIK